MVHSEGSHQAPTATMHKGNVFVFRNCRFSVGSGVKRKAILKGVSGEVHSGGVLAIMGPSGAGKTTLLNVLSLVPIGGLAEGEVCFNGRPVTDKLFKEHMTIVPQEDHLWPFLTCRETLEYAAEFSMAVPAAARRAKVDALIAQLGLESCQNTKCGNVFFKGLSGGQKRRLSLAVALLKEPDVVFLDEPTSGLDSASAAAVMGHLKKIASSMNIMVICTIHQPSTTVFNSFDATMVLSDGRVCYAGPAQDSIQYFEDIGRPMPAHMNPAEYMLDIVNRDFTDPAEVDALIEEWANRGLIIHPPQLLPEPRSFEGVSLWRQSMTQLRRQTILSIRDPTIYFGRAIMFLFSTVFFAVVYIKCRDRTQDQVTARMFLLLWFTGVPAMMAVVSVFSSNMEFSEIKRELKNGFYHPVSYLVANTVIQIPYMAVLAVSAITASGYGIANFHAPMYGRVLLAYTLTFWAYECIAQCMSLIKNPLLGMLSYVNFWFVSFLFAGFFAREKDVVWPLKAFVYVLPMRWAFSSIVRSEFIDSTWEQARLVDTPLGYECDENVELCFGRTGTQVLTALSRTFPLFEPADNYVRDVGYIIAIACVFKLSYFAVFAFRVRSGVPVKPIASSSSFVNSLASARQLGSNLLFGASSFHGDIEKMKSVSHHVSGSLAFDACADASGEAAKQQHTVPRANSLNSTSTTPASQKGAAPSESFLGVAAPARGPADSDGIVSPPRRREPAPATLAEPSRTT